MRKIIALAVATSAIVAGHAIGVALVNVGASTIPTNVSSCQEGQPCWSCHTMGNHLCGPTSDARNFRSIVR